MALRKSFFDEVKKEVECSVCQEQFNEIKEPKMLKCLHTFCKTCLERWLQQQREEKLSCPTCRHITECPNNDINSLRSNLFCKHLVEIVEAYSERGQEDSSQCGNCFIVSIAPASCVKTVLVVPIRKERFSEVIMPKKFQV